jgi:hypothetical protein
MANVQHPGFLVHSKGGTVPELVRLQVGDNNTDRIAIGDALDEGGGNGLVIAHTTEAGEVYSVMIGGASYIDSSTGARVDRQALPAATRYSTSGVAPADASYVFGVEDMVNTRFRASVDEAIALTDVNLNYAMVLTVTTTNFSKHELDATGRATTATIPWRMQDFVIGDPKVDVTLADAHVICRANAAERDPALERSGSDGS